MSIAPDALTSFVRAVFVAHGVPVGDAELVADSLVQAELWGHPSHGVLRLSWYIERLRSGVMRAITEPVHLVDGGAVAVLDGRDGVGQVIAAAAMQDAIERAKRHGIGAVAVRNSNHFGTAIYFTRMAPPAGCIALLTTNASPAMAPWGGRQKAVGTNPWSIAAPAGRFGTAVMDIANTAVARGKIYAARQEGRPIPAGWALNLDGQPTTDPAEALLSGLVLPMAGHKGYAISFMIDMLSGVLSGSGFGAQVHGPYEAEQRSGCGHLAIALNIEAFLPLAEFERRMERLIEEVKGVPLAEGFTEILFPGEMEQWSSARYQQEGLVLPAKTLEELTILARETGLEAHLPF